MCRESKIELEKLIMENLNDREKQLLQMAEKHTINHVNKVVWVMIGVTLIINIAPKLFG